VVVFVFLSLALIGLNGLIATHRRRA